MSRDTDLNMFSCLVRLKLCCSGICFCQLEQFEFIIIYQIYKDMPRVHEPGAGRVQGEITSGSDASEAGHRIVLMDERTSLHVSLHLSQLCSHTRVCSRLFPPLFSPAFDSTRKSMQVLMGVR